MYLLNDFNLTFSKVSNNLKLMAIIFFSSLTIVTSAGAATDLIEVVDIAGRTVNVKHGVNRVVLGEGRLMYSIAVLDKEAPFKNIVGWKDDLINYDPDAFRKFRAINPIKVDSLKNFGSPYSGDFSIESAIKLDADLVILSLGNLFKARESGVIEKLEKVGIPVVFIDFRQHPSENTIPSLQLLGKVFAKEKKADEFINFYRQQLSVVRNVVDTLAVDEKPLVFLENAPGWSKDFCCNTYGSANFGRVIEEAGGVNLGSLKFTGFKGEVSLETIIADDPDVIIGTGANWAEARPEVTSVLLGYEAEDESVQTKLKALADRKGFNTTKAVKNKRFHSIYHQFYNSPYRFIAVQAFAKWIHPEQFKDLDPTANFAELHKRFLPFELEGIFWSSLK